MSQPNVVEAARELSQVYSNWPTASPEVYRAFDGLNAALAALPPGPCVCVPVELVKEIIEMTEVVMVTAAIHSMKEGALSNMTSTDKTRAAHIVDKLYALLPLTAQMPQKEEG